MNSSRKRSLMIFSNLLIIFYCAYTFFNSNLSGDGGPHIQTTFRGYSSIRNPRTKTREEKTCSPQKHIYFLKMHKSASSTIQNVLLRFGVKNNLTFAFPYQGIHFDVIHPFQSYMLDHWNLPPSGLVDLFCLHARYNFKELSKILHSDTFWMTIIRKPEDQFESMYIYGDLEKYYGRIFRHFLDQPVEHIHNLPRFKEHIGPNQMFFDLGVPQGGYSLNASEMNSKIKSLDKQFDLVLIAEKLDESLILLREALCWTMDDILYLSRNIRKAQFRANLTDSKYYSQKLRDINNADSTLYDYFLEKHQQKVKIFGKSRMAREVELLGILGKSYVEDCGIKIEGAGKKAMFGEGNKHVQNIMFESERKICMLLSLPEKEFINMVRQRQKELIIN